jgi:6-phosphofructokinase
MRIGLLTGGGDCPGLNAVIRGIVRKGINVHGHEFVGFRYGWAGVLNNEAMELTNETTRGILHRGGTILGSSRTNPYKIDGGVEQVREAMRQRGLNALIPIGGEDTLGVARRLVDEGIPVVGVPKTIDNDVAATDFTFGFRPFDIDDVCSRIKRRHSGGSTFSIVVVAEGATPKDGDIVSEFGGAADAFGHVRLGGIAVALEKAIEERTGFESRMTILGHVQRGGTPVAYDRVLGTRFGVSAIDAVTEGDYGKMVALRGTDIVRVPLDEALAEPKLLDPAVYETAEVFFG